MDEHCAFCKRPVWRDYPVEVDGIEGECFIHVCKKHYKMLDMMDIGVGQFQ